MITTVRDRLPSIRWLAGGRIGWYILDSRKVVFFGFTIRSSTANIDFGVRIATELERPACWQLDFFCSSIAGDELAAENKEARE